MIIIMIMIIIIMNAIMITCVNAIHVLRYTTRANRSHAGHENAH